MSSTLSHGYQIPTGSSVDLYSNCPSLVPKKPERYFGLFATEEGPTVLLKWANSPESDDWVQDLLDVAKNSFSPEESIFALYCLKWLHKHRSLPQRKGFEEIEDISATANLSTRFKSLTDGKYRGTEDPSKLMRDVVRSANLFIRRYGSYYQGLAKVLDNDVGHPAREDLLYQVEDIEDKSFFKEFLEDKFMIMDMGECSAAK